jgi:glycosyltransferase involved in cell wall biosynthesis
MLQASSWLKTLYGLYVGRRKQMSLWMSSAWKEVKMKTKITNVSVVIPLYNKERHIKRAVTSVIGQTYKCFELIIVNDGSTDSSLTKAEGIKDERIRIVDQENLGESAARNRGIEEAKHDLIAFLDADDKWESEFLENIVSIAEKYPHAGMIGTAFKKVNIEGETIYPELKSVPAEEGIIDNFFKAVLDCNPICTSSMAVQKEVFNQLGGFTVGMRRGQDAIMLSKIALNYPVAFINKFLGVVYLNADNRASIKVELIDDYPLLEYISSLNKEFEEEEYYYIREYINKWYLKLAGRCLRVGDKRQAKLFLSKAKQTKLYRRNYLSCIKNLYLPDPMNNILTGIWRKIRF